MEVDRVGDVTYYLQGRRPGARCNMIVAGIHRHF